MKKIFSLFLLFTLCNLTFAQDKTYTMREAVIGLYTNLAPENLEQLAWIPGENSFTKLTKEGTRMVKISVPDLKETDLLNLDEINKIFDEENALKRFPQISWADASTLYFRKGNIYYLGSLKNGNWHFDKWIELPEDADNLQIDKTQKQIAFTLENNLFLADKNGNIHIITDEKDSDIVSGQVVSRFEFGVEQGGFFSPGGNYLAFYQKDESKVSDYPIIDWESVPAENRNIKYPMSGQESEKVSMGIYNTQTKNTVWLQVDKEYDDYLTNVSWSPDEQHIYVSTFKRNQKQLTLNKYDVRTGLKTANLFEESDSKYVHSTHPLSFIPGRNDEFIWWSQRDGFMHLYRYNSKGKLLNQITKGDWVVNSIDGWNAKKNEIIISASKLSPLNKTVYAVNWKNGKMRVLEETPGVHAANVNDNGAYWIDRMSNYSTPVSYKVATTDGKWKHELLNSKNPLKDYKQPQIKHLTLTAADGKTPLYARLILPPDLDETKKYPTVVYLYNGPGVQLLQNRFPESGNLWYDYLAQNGYIIFTMDGRGSANRGLAFEQAVHKNLGVEEMKDQLKGVEYLKSLPYVDSDKLGVHGWSYGGFMTTSLMLKYPDVFKAGVAGGPVIDWRMYEIMYTERYMESPQNNPDGYKETDLLDKVKDLKGKLLVIHGAQDDVVIWQHSMRLLRASVMTGTQIDYFVYPAHPHNVRGLDRIHLMQKITDYFDSVLKD